MEAIMEKGFCCPACGHEHWFVDGDKPDTLISCDFCGRLFYIRDVYKDEIPGKKSEDE